MASARVAVPLLLLLLLLLILLVFAAAKSESGAATGGEGGSGSGCRDLATRDKCVATPRRCRWCRSDALDDMCFGAGEAWRLPHQVFSCDSITAAAAR